MSILKEGALEEEEEAEGGGTTEAKTVTALSILEGLSAERILSTAPAEGSAVDVESEESLADSVERSPIEDDVFELEGLEGVRDRSKALSKLPAVTAGGLA